MGAGLRVRAAASGALAFGGLVRIVSATICASAGGFSRCGWNTCAGEFSNRGHLIPGGLIGRAAMPGRTAPGKDGVDVIPFLWWDLRVRSEVCLRLNAEDVKVGLPHECFQRLVIDVTVKPMGILF